MCGSRGHVPGPRAKSARQTLSMDKSTKVSTRQPARRAALALPALPHPVCVCRAAAVAWAAAVCPWVGGCGAESKRMQARVEELYSVKEIYDKSNHSLQVPPPPQGSRKAPAGA